MRPKICITMGDPSGIGAEIAVKALANPQVYEKCIPLVIGDIDPLADMLQFAGMPLRLNQIDKPEEALGIFGVIDVIPMGILKKGDWEYKKIGAIQGKAAFVYIEHGIKLALERRVAAVVTGPISKESLNLAGYHYAGHTEIFTDLTATERSAMLLCSKTLRVIHVTTHVSMRNACDLIKKERVLAVIRLAYLAMRHLGISSPRIAVAGLNAHCSENGLFGNEEEQEISPAINEARAEGINVDGPIPPDTVFVKAQSGAYDVVVAMYHDQGHIPLKLSGFKLDPVTNRYTEMSGVNCTIGLPIIRTSVDHGTAFGKAGEGRANEESMLDAIDAAVTMVQNRSLMETNK